MREENRRLRAELRRAREDLAHERERLAYALHQVAELRRLLPATQRQAAAPIVRAARATDPLEVVKLTGAAISAERICGC